MITPRLVMFPHQGLRRRAIPVDSASFGTTGLRDYCQALSNILTAVERADVLAGTQLSTDPAFRVLCVAMNREEPGKPAQNSVLINPEISDLAGESVDFENCASFACTPALVSAPASLVVRYRTFEGGRREVKCSRSGARAVFTGVESLNGRPMVDRMTAPQAMQLVKRYREDIQERAAPSHFLAPEPTYDILH